MTFISCSKEFLWGKKPRGLGAAWHGVTARNGQVWQQSVKLRVCYIEIHLIESFHSIHENWFPYILILIKTQYSRNLHVIQGLSVILSFGWEEVLCNSGDWPGTGRLRKHGDLVEQPIRGQQLEQSGGQCQPASRSVWNMSRSVKWTVYDNPSWVFFIFCWSGKGEWL